MAVLRVDIERGLDELVSQEEGMRFQGLAVVLGKKRWPELFAHQRKKDFGLDAYASADLTQEKFGKGLAASITPTLKKISDDAKTAKKNYPDLQALLFVTPAKVGNADRKRWEKAINIDPGLQLHIIEREEIITQMMMPENASLCASFLHLDIDAEPTDAELINKTRRATEAVTQAWARKTKGHPLIDLTAVRLSPDGAESTDLLSLEDIDQALAQSRRLVLEGPAGRGKTTTLIQLAQRALSTSIPFIVELPAWTSSRQGILNYIAGIHAFQAEGLTAADLARVQQTEPFLLLLNGWNEIAESNSMQANDALRELERDFPGAGIIVATRTHHLTPPLPGALRLRLLSLSREQRAAYLAARFGVKNGGLRALIDADPSLDELTRTPFILSEVASLFEAGVEIPSTKIGVLAEVLLLQEQRDEHRNALQSAPTFGRQADYLKALATEMTRLGAVALPEADARTVTATITRELVEQGQIEPVGAPNVIATLTAHHVVERLDYPETAFQFEHQQLQEYYASLDLQTLLLALRNDDHEVTNRFMSEYVNDSAWAEPLRMIAEKLAEQTSDGETDKQNTHAGAKLVEMALAVDPVFSGELGRLCGGTVWKEVRAVVEERFRSVYSLGGSYRLYALAAMLSTGANDFSDIIVPLLSGQDQQARLSTYRLWPDIKTSSLGSNWRELLHGWSEEARADFVSEMLHQNVDEDIVAFAAEDKSIAVKEAAVSALMWTGSEEALIHILKSMDAKTFDEVALKNADFMPVALRPETTATMRKFIESTEDHPARLRTALGLIELGETDLDGVIKAEIAALSGNDMHDLNPRLIQSALEYLRKTDPAWASEWVAIQIAEGGLYEHEYWLQFVTAIPDDLVEKYLRRLETEDFKDRSFEGIADVIATRADVNLAVRIFAKLRELRRKVDAEPGVRHEFEWKVMSQLEAVFRHLPDDVAAAGVLSSVTSGDSLDTIIAINLLSRVDSLDMEPLRIEDDELKARLREYLKSSIDVVLQRDDFNGKEKADLASSIAKVGRPEDMADLVTLIRADIERMRRGQAARAARDSGPLVDGANMSYAGRQTSAVLHLDKVGAAQVLIDLLPEPEYLSEVAAAMARDFLPKPKRSFGRTLDYDLIWAAREGLVAPPTDEQRRIRFATALNAEIKRLRKSQQNGKTAAGVKVLAKALATIDAHGSAEVVLDAIATPGRWNQRVRLKAAERLLMAGVVLPAATAFALVDSFVEQTEVWMQDSERNLMSHILTLCPFVDDTAAGITKMREVLGVRQIWGHELREIITALGESHSDDAFDLLYEFATDPKIFRQCADVVINAFAALDTPRARELLLGFVDPDVRGIALIQRMYLEEMVVARITELAQRMPHVAEQLRELCERDLPELNRHILSRVMHELGTSEAITANLDLINDTKRPPIPQGILDQLKSAFTEQRPYGQNTHFFTEHARPSNELREQLFNEPIRMAHQQA